MNKVLCQSSQLTELSGDQIENSSYSNILNNKTDNGNDNKSNNVHPIREDRFNIQSIFLFRGVTNHYEGLFVQ